MASMRLNVGQPQGALWQELWQLLCYAVGRCDEAFRRLMLVSSQLGRIAPLVEAVSIAALQGPRPGAATCSTLMEAFPVKVDRDTRHSSSACIMHAVV